jgi:ubiquinone/menaquinone biosynthesis C-methylase UbiE
MNMQSPLDKQDTTSVASKYAFDNVNEFAEDRYRELSALYDAQTIRHLERTGIVRGWHCLEVGGGGGSITSWLCERVENQGRVLATDIEPGFLQTLSFNNLEVRRHDIRIEGFPEFQFDLAHARLLLMHLPERELALRRILASLKPGGWIVLEEFDTLSVFPDSGVNPDEEEVPILRACYEVLNAHGVDLRYGRRLPLRLLANGLVNVGAEASLSLWEGQSPGTSLFKINFEDLADPIIRCGLMSQDQFEAALRRFDEQDFRMLSPTMWTAWGQVPEFTPYAASLNVHGTTEQGESLHG